MENKNILILAVIYSCAITVLFLLPSSDLPRVKMPGGSDKAVHMIIHFILVVLWMLFIFKRNNNQFSWKLALIVLGASLLYGIIIEFLQGRLTTSRTPDFLDVLANFGGALIGVLVFQRIRRLFTP